MAEPEKEHYIYKKTDAVTKFNQVANQTELQESEGWANGQWIKKFEDFTIKYLQFIFKKPQARTSDVPGLSTVNNGDDGNSSVGQQINALLQETQKIATELDESRAAAALPYMANLTFIKRQDFSKVDCSVALQMVDKFKEVVETFEYRQLDLDAQFKKLIDFVENIRKLSEFLLKSADTANPQGQFSGNFTATTKAESGPAGSNQPGGSSQPGAGPPSGLPFTSDATKNPNSTIEGGVITGCTPEETNKLLVSLIGDMYHCMLAKVGDDKKKSRTARGGSRRHSKISRGLVGSPSPKYRSQYRGSERGRGQELEKASGRGQEPECGRGRDLSNPKNNWSPMMVKGQGLSTNQAGGAVNISSVTNFEDIRPLNLPATKLFEGQLNCSFGAPQPKRKSYDQRYGLSKKTFGAKIRHSLSPYSRQPVQGQANQEAMNRHAYQVPGQRQDYQESSQRQAFKQPVNQKQTYQQPMRGETYQDYMQPMQSEVGQEMMRGPVNKQLVTQKPTHQQPMHGHGQVYQQPTRGQTYQQPMEVDASQEPLVEHAYQRQAGQMVAGQRGKIVQPNQRQGYQQANAHQGHQLPTPNHGYQQANQHQGHPPANQHPGYPQANQRQAYQLPSQRLGNQSHKQEPFKSNGMNKMNPTCSTAPTHNQTYGRKPYSPTPQRTMPPSSYRHGIPGGQNENSQSISPYQTSDSTVSRPRWVGAGPLGRCGAGLGPVGSCGLRQLGRPGYGPSYTVCSQPQRPQPGQFGPAPGRHFPAPAGRNCTPAPGRHSGLAPGRHSGPAPMERTGHDGMEINYCRDENLLLKTRLKKLEEEFQRQGAILPKYSEAALSLKESMENLKAIQEENHRLRQQLKQNGDEINRLRKDLNDSEVNLSEKAEGSNKLNACENQNKKLMNKLSDLIDVEERNSSLQKEINKLRATGLFMNDREALRSKIRCLEKRIQDVVQFVDDVYDGVHSGGGNNNSNRPQTSSNQPTRGNNFNDPKDTVTPTGQALNTVLDRLEYLEETLDVFDRKYDAQRGQLLSIMKQQETQYKNIGVFSKEIKTIKNIMQNTPGQTSTYVRGTKQRTDDDDCDGDDCVVMIDESTNLVAPGVDPSSRSLFAVN